MADTLPSDMTNGMPSSLDGVISNIEKGFGKKDELAKERADIGTKERQTIETSRAQISQVGKDHPYVTPDIKPWTEAPPEPDPVKSFGSWASTLGIIASALTKTPLTSALNASSSAMKAIRNNDLDKYAEAKDAWKKNTDLAIQQAQWENQKYDHAMDLAKTDQGLALAEIKSLAAEFNDKSAMLAASSGDWQKIGQLIEGRQRLAQSGALNAAKLKEIADEQHQTLLTRKMQDDAAKEYIENEKANGRQPTALGMAKARGDIESALAGKASLKGGMPTMSGVEAQAVQDLVSKGVPYTEAIKQVNDAAQRTPRSPTAMLLQKWKETHPNSTPEEQTQAYARIGEQTQAAKAFGTGKQGDTARSLNVAISHLAALKDYADALDNGDARYINEARAYLHDQFGDAAPATFDDAKRFVSDETVKAIVGAGGTGEDRQNAESGISRSSSPAEMAGVISERTRLMAGQLDGLKRQYTRTTGLTNFDEEFLSPEASEAFDKYRYSGDSKTKSGKAGSYSVGSIITGPNGKKYRVTGGDMSDPDVEPVE